VPLLLAALSIDADAASTAEGGAAVASSGSKVLFLTAANGGVIEACDVGGCNSHPALMASGLDNANNTGSAGLLALGRSWAYWPGQAAVNDVSIAGPTTVSMFARPANASVFAVATNASQVFWSDTNLGIWSCAIGAACGSPTSLLPAPAMVAAPQVLAADETYVYWMDANGSVFSAPVGGGSPVLLQGGGDAAPSPGFALPMVASGGHVYYADVGSGQLMTAAGSTAASASTYSTDTPQALATDGISLYWSNGVAIQKCALGATCASSIWIYGTSASALAVDAMNLYWIDDGAGSQGVPSIWEFHK
jgi:hypothetical protein